MYLLFSFCELSWWIILVLLLVPFAIGWLLSRLITSDPGSSEGISLNFNPEVNSGLKNTIELKSLQNRHLQLENTLVECRKEGLALKRNLFELEEQIRFISKEKDVNKAILDTADHKSLMSSGVPIIRPGDSIEVEKSNVNQGNLIPDIATKNVSEIKPSPSAKIMAANQANIEMQSFRQLSPENLQIFEGLGPKMETFLKSLGIKNWSELAVQDHILIKSKLEKLDPKYRILEPDSWPIQAALARDGEWIKLIDYQKRLSAGKSREDTIVTESKLEKIMHKLGLIKKYAQNDLKAVEGIGPKIEKLLNAAGIKTWNELANADTDFLRSVLEKEGAKYQLADPETWPIQAKIASEGRWRDLFDYQDTLKGGKKV